MTITYKLSVTNLEFTLGLIENTDRGGNKINDGFYYPEEELDELEGWDE